MSTVAEAIAQELEITIPVVDPESDDAYLVADALTDLLAEICECDVDWRRVLEWAVKSPVTDVPSDLRAPEFRAVDNFRAEHLDPDGGLLDANTRSEDLAASLGIPLVLAQRRVATVQLDPLNQWVWGYGR